MNMLAAMTFWQWGLAILMIALCALLMLVVLIQRGRGQGLSGAFGGGGGGGTFGAKTGDVFTWITVSLTAFFLFLNVVGIFVFDQSPVAAAQTVPSGQTEAPPPVPGQSAPATGTEGEGAPVKVKGMFQGVTKDGKTVQIPIGGTPKPAEGATKNAGGKAPPGAAKPADEAKKKPAAEPNAPAAGGSETPASGGGDSGGSKEGGSDKG